MYAELSKNAKKLADYMSEISEEGYDARWMHGIEYALWYAVSEQQTIKYGNAQVSFDDILQLKALSQACGGWLMYDNEKELVVLDVEEWKNIYQSQHTQYKALYKEFAF